MQENPKSFIRSFSSELRNVGVIFTDLRILEVFLFGIFSGIPLAILITSLSAYLKDSGMMLEVITTFAIARLPYSLKFTWSPLIDYLKVPLLHRLGHRKSWMMCCSAAIAVILFFIARVDPNEQLMELRMLAIGLGFFSASFDISFDAFRICKVPQELQGIGAANTVLGYRIGMLIAGGGMLIIAHQASWQTAFDAMSILYACSLALLLLVKEPDIASSMRHEGIAFFDGLIKSVILPFLDFFRRDYAVTILFAVVLFKLGDALLGVVSTPFYKELGFSNQDIGVIIKGYGVIATILGSYFGGIMVYKFGYLRGMIIGGIAQSVTNFAFVWLNHHPGEIQALFIAISIENFASGMASAALVAYLSILCNKQYSATQYALLSSASSVCNNTITVYGGSMARALGWDWFFSLTVVLGLPAVLLFLYLNRRLMLSAPVRQNIRS